MGESASATITATQLGPSTYQYTVMLDDTGSTTIGTFWFAWVPGEDFLDTKPSSVTAPAGWTTTLQMRVRTTGLPFNGSHPPRPRIFSREVH